MFPTSLSSHFAVRRLTEGDLAQILDLCRGNPLFYRYCPPSPSAGRDHRRLSPPAAAHPADCPDDLGAGVAAFKRIAGGERHVLCGTDE